MPLDRREFLLRASLVLGAALSTSCAQAVLGRRPEEAFVTPEPLLDRVERLNLEAAIDRILPRTATPGALDAGVLDFVEFVLAEAASETERERFREGLARLQSEAEVLGARSFAELANEDRDPILRAFEEEELAGTAGVPNVFGGTTTDKPFFSFLKELTVVGFFTSKIGAMQVYQMQMWPGRFDGCVALAPGRKPQYSDF